MTLSARRRRILEIILPAVVPSRYGSAAFKRIDANWAPGKAYTTCGGLPALVARELGMAPDVKKEGLGIGGLAGMRDAAIKRKAWRHNEMTPNAAARPKPGDFYVLCSGPRHDPGCNCVSPSDPAKSYLYKGAKVEHVGIIVDASTNLWKTADAGQGNSTVTQEALYVMRNFNPFTNLMTGEANRQGKPMRRLCGWLDVDAYPFLT